MSRQLTNKEFIDRCSKLHNDKYTYLSEYTGNRNRIDIKCPIHGIFDQIAATHLKGSGCNKCGQVQSGDTQRKPHDEYVKIANVKHNGIYTYVSEYEGALYDIDIKCPIHGKFSQNASKHMIGSKCPICSRENSGCGWHVDESDPRINDIWYMYTIKLNNGNETFYKTGITDNYKRRFNHIELKGYSVEIIDIIIDIKRNCFNLEQKLLNKKRRKNKMYKPKIDFSGKTECYKI